MRPWRHLLPLLVLLGCSSLDEGEAGVVGLEIEVPTPAVLEVGETAQLTARPLNQDGEVVDVPVHWLAIDPTVTVDELTGLVTGVGAGTGRVQASVGSLVSELVSFSVLAPADTIVLTTDSVVIAPLDPGVTPALNVRLDSFNPAGPLGSRPVIFEITRPVAEPLAATFAGGVRVDTLTTAADGVAGAVVSLTPGQPIPDTVLVEVRAERTRGAVVPGSGQRFIILFQ